MSKKRRAKNLDWQPEQIALIEGAAPCSFSCDRQGTMQKVQKFVDACCPYCCNPLPSLRRAYPGLEWKYWTVDAAVDSWPSGEIGEKAKKVRTRIAKEADFVWFVTGSCNFVTAKTIGSLVINPTLYLFDNSDKQVKTPHRAEFPTKWPRR
ncbi:MAG: hypothetical protein WC348_04460 [Patescibacteria group bacterium]|jgi:hypothetical protein